MPPKKKAGGKGGTGNIIDGVDTTQMTREQLEIFCVRIKEENEREREERNFFQMERDKMRTFWEITKKELEEVRAKLRNKERQIEEANEKNEEELKFFKQKIKHLQYEHQNNLTENKAEALVSLKNAQDGYYQQENVLIRDKRTLKEMLAELELAHQDQVKGLKLQHSEEMCKAFLDLESKAKIMETKYEKRFSELKNQFERIHNMEIVEVEERKNNHISELIKNHEVALKQLKQYYNDITNNNLDTISELKADLQIMNEQNEQLKKQLADLRLENNRLTKPLEKSLEEVKEFKRKLEAYEKDKLSLANVKANLKNSNKQLEELRWVYDALELRFQEVQIQKDELHKNFVKGILEVQQKTATKNVLLQKRIQTLTESGEYKEAVIGELSSALEKPPAKSGKTLEDILSKKNSVIHDLQYELARVCKSHDDLLQKYEEKIKQYGLPKEELGLRYLRIAENGEEDPLNSIAL